MSRAGSESPVAEGTWEVEEVLDFMHDSAGDMYLVKWKDWDSDFNTWEPPENLGACEEELLRFYLVRKAAVSAVLEQSEWVEAGKGKKRRKGPPLKLQLPPDPRPVQTRALTFYEQTRQPTQEERQEAETLWRSDLAIGKKRKSSGLLWPLTRLSETLEEGMGGGMGGQTEDRLRQQLLLHELEGRRQEVVKQIKAWEDEINQITDGMPNIRVENEVDLVGPPPGFKYINDYIGRGGISIPDDPPMGCSCTDCFENRKGCCAPQFNSTFAYTMHKKLRVEVGTPIYECNRRCKCGPSCPNRLVQDGRESVKDARLAIFRTPTGCGWGVKTLKAIKKGSFVTLYVGEVIGTEEAERRGREYDAEGCTYLFDLDFNEGDACPYTVDAAKFGNIAHFLNHSCDPNLAVFAVWVNCLDPNLPKLALFAIKDIPRGSELTFDYKNQIWNGPEEEVLTTTSPPKERKACLCASDNCRKFLF